MGLLLGSEASLGRPGCHGVGTGVCQRRLKSDLIFQRYNLLCAINTIPSIRQPDCKDCHGVLDWPEGIFEIETAELVFQEAPFQS
jgi:hypothetical protein